MRENISRAFFFPQMTSMNDPTPDFSQILKYLHDPNTEFSEVSACLPYKGTLRS